MFFGQGSTVALYKRLCPVACPALLPPVLLSCPPVLLSFPPVLLASPDCPGLSCTGARLCVCRHRLPSAPRLAQTGGSTVEDSEMTRGHRAVTHLYVVLLVGLRLPVGREVVRDAVLGGGGRPLVVLVVVAVHLVEHLTELVALRSSNTLTAAGLQLQHSLMVSTSSPSSSSSS